MLKDLPLLHQKIPGADDIFIPPNETKSAMHGDTVMVRISSETSGSRREGTIIRILERGVTEDRWNIFRKQEFWLCYSG